MTPMKIRLTRKELYEEIWNISVAGVSRKYGIPYVRCLEKIKAARIPVPSSGYWAQLNYGKYVERAPLSGDGDEVVELIQETLPGVINTEKRKFPEEIDSGSSLESPPVETSPQKSPEVESDQSTVAPPETMEKFGQIYNVYHRESLSRNSASLLEKRRRTSWQAGARKESRE